MQGDNPMMGRMTGYFVMVIAFISLNCVCLNETHAKSKDLAGFLGGGTVDDATNQLKSIASTSIKQFLDGMNELANELLKRGTNAGSLLEIQAANEMTNLIFTLRSQFGGEMDRQISAASAQIMPVLVELQRWRNTIDKFNGTLFGIEDLVALDIGDLPFAKIPLSVRRVYGGVFVEGRPETFYVDLVGQHFGGADGIETTFKVTLDGQVLAAPELRPPHEAVFSIPASAIEGRFDKEKVVTLPLDIVVTRKTAHWWDHIDVFGQFTDIRSVHLPYKVSLLADEVGMLTITNEYPHFDWQALQDVVPQFTVVTGPDQPLGPYDSPAPVKNGVPERLNTKIDPKSIDVKCVGEMVEGREFGKGRALPATHEIFTKGFRSTNNCGSKGDRDAALGTIHAEFKSLFNFDKALNCGEGEYGWLTAEELKANSKPVQMDISGCRDMQYDKDFQWSPEAVGFRVRLIGHPLDPTKTFFKSTDRTPGFAKWRVTYQLLTYEATDKTDSDPIQTIPVSASKPISFKVAKHLGNTSTKVTFTPRIGPPVTRKPGDQLGTGLQPVGMPNNLATHTEYLYEFKYPDLNLSHLRAVDGLQP
jgi:hypothetical protein